MSTTTRVIGNLAYGYSEDGQMLWMTVNGKPEPIATDKPEAGLAPFWWETRPISADAAHEATQAMGKGQR
jgi:hypothetical protein